MTTGTESETLAQRVLAEIRGFAGALVLALFITTFGFTTVGVAGSSMEPTLDGGQDSRLEALVSGDRLFVPKYETWLRRAGLMEGYERGQIVIVREPAESPARKGWRNLVVKRVIGVPGDTIALLNGRVFINGAELDQGFITEEGISLGHSTFPPFMLEENEYFILGDNRTNSVDSRLYGPVPFMSITGRASAVLYPLRRQGAWNIRRLQIPHAFELIPDS